MNGASPDDTPPDDEPSEDDEASGGHPGARPVDSLSVCLMTPPARAWRESLDSDGDGGGEQDLQHDRPDDLHSGCGSETHHDDPAHSYSGVAALFHDAPPLPGGVSTGRGSLAAKLCREETSGMRTALSSQWVPLPEDGEGCSFRSVADISASASAKIVVAQGSEAFNDLLLRLREEHAREVRLLESALQAREMELQLYDGSVGLSDASPGSRLSALHLTAALPLSRLSTANEAEVYAPKGKISQLATERADSASRYPAQPALQDSSAAKAPRAPRPREKPSPPASAPVSPSTASLPSATSCSDTQHREDVAKLQQPAPPSSVGFGRSDTLDGEEDLPVAVGCVLSMESQKANCGRLSLEMMGSELSTVSGLTTAVAPSRTGNSRQSQATSLDVVNSPTIDSASTLPGIVACDTATTAHSSRISEVSEGDHSQEGDVFPDLCAKDWGVSFRPDDDDDEVSQQQRFASMAPSTSGSALCATVPDRPSTLSARKRPLPRIAGLKQSKTSCLKTNSGKVRASNVRMQEAGRAKRAVGTSVMFDETAEDSCIVTSLSGKDLDHVKRPTKGMSVTFIPRPIWLQKDETEIAERGEGPRGSQQTNNTEPPSVSHAGTAQTMLNAFSNVVPNRLSFGSAATSPVGSARKRLLNSSKTYVMHPSSKLNFYCDMLTIFWICHDMIMIPMQVFAFSETHGMKVMFCLATLFWSWDIVRHFFKGYYSQGDAVMNANAVACRYLMTWAPLDMALVVTDWVELVSLLVDVDEQPSGVIRILRNVRAIRLLRGMKTGAILKILEDRIQSETVGILWTTAKLLICILFANHVSACIWFWIGGFYDADSDMPSWHAEYLSGHPAGDTVLYQYLTSFHWAITQFTPASIKVQPENSVERLYGIIMLMCAFVTMSTFISGITSAVMQLQQLSSVKRKQFWLLRKYLGDSKVPTKLAVRIHNFCDHAWGVRGKRLGETNVQLLGLLSLSLRMELKHAIFAPRLTEHAFYMLLQIRAPASLRSICSTAVVQSEVTCGGDLFVGGEDARHMFFIERQELVYKVSSHGRAEVADLSWVCEACLWVNWHYRGTLTAVCDTTAISVSAEGFGKVVQLNGIARAESVAYAKCFVQGMNRTQAGTLCDLYENQLEGVWFRLFKDFQVTKRATVTRSRRENASSYKGVHGRLTTIGEAVTNRMGSIFQFRLSAAPAKV